MGLPNETAQWCPIWGEGHEATRSLRGSTPREKETEDLVFAADVWDSARAGGRFVITEEAQLSVKEKCDRWKARLTTWLIDRRELGDKEPVVTPKVVAYIDSRRPLPVHVRAERLLRYLAKWVVGQGAGSELEIYQHSPAEYAWSESTAWYEEVLYLLKYLSARGWLGGEPIEMGRCFAGTVTVDGHSLIEAQATNIDSSQAFVAMWFDKSMDGVFDKGIKPGIEDAGYKAMIINRKDYTNKIDDEIIAEIRRSRFLVADFTHGKDGARGSVYYEAGFAHGLGRDVIFTCKESENPEEGSKLAFDTRQYPHIFWKTCEDLREQLKNRIEAVMGEGPHKNDPLSTP